MDAYSFTSINDVICDITGEDREIAEEGIFSGPSTTGSVILYWDTFKYEWKKLKNNLNACRSLDEQEKVLWEMRNQLLTARDNIDRIPENGFLNICAMVGILAVTFGLAVNVLGIPGTAGAATMIVGEVMGMVYASLKMMGMMMKYADPTRNILPNQSTTGVLSKQLATAKINNMLKKNEEKIQHVMAGKLLETNRKVLNAMNQYSDKYCQKIIETTNKVQKDLGNDMFNQTANKYFNSGNPKPQNQAGNPKPNPQKPQNGDNKGNNSKGNNH